MIGWNRSDAEQTDSHMIVTSTRHTCQCSVTNRVIVCDSAQAALRGAPEVGPKEVLNKLNDDDSFASTPCFQKDVLLGVLLSAEDVGESSHCDSIP